MRKALGRGLDALLPAQHMSTAGGPIAEARPLMVPIAKIRPNHLQPRRYFDPERLAELAASIKTHGLAQPLLVSLDSSGTYELIAGERRLRACELAGLKDVEVIVRQPAGERERLALTLIENLQREDLNAVETALGYLRLTREFGINQNQVADFVGKSKQSISNTMRILQLPEDIQKAIQHGQIQEGHGRALLMVEDPTKRHKLFSTALERKLSVREIEDLARKLNSGEPTAEAKERPQEHAAEKNPDIRELENALQRRLGTKISIRTKKDATGGRLIIHFYSLADFERLVGLINK